MSKILVNLTLPLVETVTERVLITYPECPHQKVLANPDVRQELFAYVLTRIHNTYQAVEVDFDSEDPPVMSPDCPDDSSFVEALIHEGIPIILSQHGEEVSCQLAEEYAVYQPAAHWFG